MVELTAKRSYTSKTIDNEDGTFTLEAHAGHIHYKDAVGDLQDVDYTLVDQGTYWSMTKASYRLYIAKDFDSSELVRFVNRYEGANHTIKYNAHSLWWFDATDPQNTRTKIEDAQSVTGTLVGTNKVRYTDAFGSGIHFEVTVRRHGVRKEIIVDDLSDLGASPYSNYLLVPIFTWDAVGLSIKAADLPTWDDDSYYESQEYFDISESNPTYVSRILHARGWDSATPRPRSKQLKIIFEKKGGVLYQGKLITRNMIENAVFPIRADATTNYYVPNAEDGYCVTTEESHTTWNDAHDSSSEPADDSASALGVGAVNESPYYYLYRIFVPIDTSGMDDTAVVSAAVLHMYGTLKENDDQDAQDYLVVVGETSQANTNAVVDADFDQCGSIDSPTEGSNQIDFPSITAAGYNDFALNATGRGWVDPEGITKLGLREGHDVEDVAIAADSANVVGFSSQEETGTNQDPYLEVTYTVGLSISVSDSLTTQEDIGPSSPLAGISKFDSATITEVVSLMMRILPVGTDIVTIQEVVSAVMSGLAASPFDTISVSETVLAILDKHNIVVSDTIEVAEDISASMPLAGISVSDVIEVVENVAILMNLAEFSVSDLINITQAVTVALGVVVLTTSVSDTISVSQAVSVAMLLATTGVFDSIELSQAVTVAIGITTITKTVFDSIEVSQSVELAMQLAAINLFDTLEVSEFVSLITQLADLSLADSIALTEDINLVISSIVADLEILAIFDQISLSENITSVLSGLLSSPSDSISVSELVTVTVTGIVWKAIKGTIIRINDQISILSGLYET